MIIKDIKPNKIRSPAQMKDYLSRHGQTNLMRFNMKAVSPEDTASFLDKLKSSNKRTLEEKKDKHIVISLSKGEKLSQNEWRDVIRDFLRKNNYDKGASIAAVHNETGNQHAHIYVVSIDQKKHTKIKDKYKNLYGSWRKWANKLERKKGWRVTGIEKWKKETNELIRNLDKISKNEPQKKSILVEQQKRHPLKFVEIRKNDPLTWKLKGSIYNYQTADKLRKKEKEETQRKERERALKIQELQERKHQEELKKRKEEQKRKEEEKHYQQQVEILRKQELQQKKQQWLNTKLQKIRGFKALLKEINLKLEKIKDKILKKQEEKHQQKSQEEQKSPFSFSASIKATAFKSAKKAQEKFNKQSSRHHRSR